MTSSELISSEEQQRNADEDLPAAAVPATIKESQNGDDHSTATAKAVVNLSTGLVSLFTPSMEQVSQSLSELIRNQNILIETVQHENAKYSQHHSTYDLNEVYARVKLYQTKLVNIKKEMAVLHEKSLKLKARAVRLQQQKEKERQQKALQRQHDIEREQDLIAKPAAKVVNSP